MKTTLLLFAFLFLAFHSISQYSRSIYSDDTQAKRHTSLFSINGETTVVSLRESSNDTLRVTLIDIDEDGETDNYRMYELSPFNLAPAFALSGVGVNPSEEVTMCILAQNANNSLDVKYITIDPASGAFSNLVQLPEQYKRGFTRTRIKGDSLITYLANFNTTGMSRISKSLSNTGVTEELYISSSTYTGTLFQNGMTCELIIDGSDEYLATSSQIIKRFGPSNYIETSYSGGIYPPNIGVNSVGELFVLHKGSGDYDLMDANLISFASGNIPELQGSFTAQSEIYALPNQGFRVWTDRAASPTVLDITSTYSVINMKASRNIPLDQFILDGKQYVLGYELSYASFTNSGGIPFQSPASNITVVSDDLQSSVLDFIEYNQVLSSDKIEFHTNHVSRSFNKSVAISPGFLFAQNGLSRPLIYSAASNILGSTINGNLVGTTATYEPTQVTGPYCDPGAYDLEVMDKYNRGYYVTQEMIETHLFEITTGNPGYDMPFGIKEWPAHGDVSLGQAANLAGFVDLNSNGTYEPELGDYPSIFGDQCLLNMYHQHPNTPNSASIETHQYYFTYDCDSSEAIENAVFIRTHNFSRSENLFNVYEGDYADFDIGNPFDDYSGTNVELGMIYVYNGDPFDEDSGGNIGFNDTIPAVGMISLQGMKLDEDGVDNVTTVPNGPLSNGIGFSDAVTDNEFFTMESSFSAGQNGTVAIGISEWWAVVQGLNPNFSPKTVNGVEIRHDYFGTSDPLFYTSSGIDHGNNHFEIGQLISPGDRRIFGSSGPSSVSIVDTMVFVKAYLVGVDTVNLSVDNSVDRLFEHGQDLRDFYAQNTLPCGNTFGSYVSSSTVAVEEEKIDQIMVYPNPANQHIQFRGIFGQAELNIFDLNGRVVLSQQGIDDNLSIDISSLDKAVYLIKIFDENGSQTIRMIKQ